MSPHQAIFNNRLYRQQLIKCDKLIEIKTISFYYITWLNLYKNVVFKNIFNFRFENQNIYTSIPNKQRKNSNCYIKGCIFKEITCQACAAVHSTRPIYRVILFDKTKLICTSHIMHRQINKYIITMCTHISIDTFTNTFIHIFPKCLIYLL